jgi:hypothetical protein
VRGAIALLKPQLLAEGAAFNLVDWTQHVPEFATSTVQIAYVGPDGKLLATSLSRNPPPVDLSDREHIRVQLTGEHKGLFIGKPVIGRVSGQPTIQVTDRIENANGKLAGVIVFSLSPEFLTTLHQVVNLRKTGSMMLFGDDGVIRASYGAWQKSDFVMGFRWRPHECARVSPARPASESPRRTTPRAASVIYGDLRGTASASVSNASVLRIAARRMQEFAASFIGEAAAAGSILGVIFAASGQRRQGVGLAA